MGGFFGVVSRQERCTVDLFYGTDYHSHLGTQRGGLATLDQGHFHRVIHDIRNAQFRSKFDDDLARLPGSSGIGVISDFEDQPLLISSHLGAYAIVTVGAVSNLDELAREAFGKRTTHFSEMSGGAINPTELVATLINQQPSFAEGIAYAQERIRGSCSMLLLTGDGLYAARDRLGRTPLVLGEKEGARAAALESCAFHNLGYDCVRDLGPGEIVLIGRDGLSSLRPPGPRMRMCAFLWVYYGYPASCYEGINVEDARYRCGRALARRDHMEVDMVSGIPDSGIAHALGYAAAAGVAYARPFVKYTPTWPRSFMPQDQTVRELVARMKLIPVQALIENRRILFCEDSIVRGTQLKETIRRVYDGGAREVHMRSACPPLMFACTFLNFSRSRSEMDLAARRAIHDLEGPDGDRHLEEYTDPDSGRHHDMVAHIGRTIGLCSLAYQTLDDLVDAIGLPRDRLCTYCWTGKEETPPSADPAPPLPKGAKR